MVNALNAISAGCPLWLKVSLVHLLKTLPGHARLVAARQKEPQQIRRSHLLVWRERAGARPYGSCRTLAIESKLVMDCLSEGVGGCESS